MILLSSVGVRPVLEEVVHDFEKSHALKVDIRFGTAVQMKARADSGEPFDLVILNPGQIDDLIAKGVVDAKTCTALARSGMGFAIAADASAPDLSSDAAMRAFLRNAKVIASGNPALGGFGSVYFDKLVDRLGIGAETRPKTAHQPPGDFAKPVAAGTADVGVGLISEMVAMANVQAVPIAQHDAASYVGFTAAISAAATQAGAARAFIERLRTPDVAKIFEARGLTPA